MTFSNSLFVMFIRVDERNEDPYLVFMLFNFFSAKSLKVCSRSNLIFFLRFDFVFFSVHFLLLKGNKTPVSRSKRLKV